jgi:hypothetical protein
MCCNDTIIINESNRGNDIVININTPSDIKLSPLLTIFNLMSSNFFKFDNAATNVIKNSSLYLNLKEVNQLSIMTQLTSKWQETTYEMDTIQDPLSSHWDYAYDVVKSRLIDGGFC